jgi:hypothetical protein
MLSKNDRKITCVTVGSLRMIKKEHLENLLKKSNDWDIAILKQFKICKQADQEEEDLLVVS